MHHVHFKDDSQCTYHNTHLVIEKEMEGSFVEKRDAGGFDRHRKRRIAELLVRNLQ